VSTAAIAGQPVAIHRTAGAGASPGDSGTGEKSKRIGPRRLIAFSSITMPLAAVEVPLGTYVPPLYASAFGFSLATVGVVFLLARLWDAFIDPAIGLLSDRTRSRWGRRRPWIAVGGVLFAAGAVPVFLPPVWFGPVSLSIALFVLYFGYSMMATPYSAWGGELSGDYHERTRITTYAMALTSIGLLLALVLPSLLVTRLEGQPRLQLAAMGAMVFVLLAISLPLGLRALPEAPVPEGKQPPLRLWHTLRLVFSEGPLLRVLSSNFAVRLAQGVRTALFVFFVSHYMGHPAWAPGLFLLQYVFGICACPIWLAIGRRIGKERAAVAGELTQVAINLGLVLLTPASVPLLLALTVAQGLAQGSGNLMLRAIVADVADHHRLKTGEDRIGLFFSVFSLSDKAGVAIAIGIALPLAAWLGFDPRHTNSPEVLNHLKLLFALGPALGHVISAAVIFGFPIDERRHGEIRRQLAARDAAGLVSDASRDRWLSSDQN
jgi:Na+/melibiose symporter-like transporter